MKLEEVNTRTKEAVDFLVAALESGHSEVLTAYLGAMAKFHTYSFGNIMLIARQKPDATNVAGLRTWNSLGRFVKRGEKGIFILAPMVGKRSTKDVATDEPSEDATTEGQRTLYGFRAVYVFDRSQTEGKDLPALTEVQGDVSGYRERLVKFVEAHGITLNYSDKIGPAKGLSYGGKITLLSGMQPAEEFSTLAHEIGHELLHRGERRTLTTKQVRETEAEAVAFVVCQAIGLETGSSSADYIALWHGDASLLRESLEAVQQTAAVILGGHCSRASGGDRSRITANSQTFRRIRATCAPITLNRKYNPMRGEEVMQATQSAVTNNEYRNISIAALVESGTNPRKRFDQTALEELAASFKTQGVLAPC
jgi:hypothetical protein